MHAAGETSPGNLPLDTNAVVLMVRDEAALLQLHAELDWPHHLVREPDAPWCGAATAIGCTPTADSQLAARLRTLPLLGALTVWPYQPAAVAQSRALARARDGGSRPPGCATTGT